MDYFQIEENHYIPHQFFDIEKLDVYESFASKLSSQ